MNYKKIKTAREEARRFLDRIKAWEVAIPEDADMNSIYNYGTKESGAIKRASLDLTRALAELRKS